jgi:transcriptional regulator with XRE-family HTH domain
MVDPELHFNARKFKEMRMMRGYSRVEMARRLSVSSSSLASIENSETNITVRIFRKICEGFTLDPLDIMELLRLKPIPLNLVIRFRAACKREGTTPLQAMIDFMEVFSE